MAWFNKITNPTPIPRVEDVLGTMYPQAAQQPLLNIMLPAERIDERRPCWARGRKALFHCWANTAHPVAPRNIPAELINEKTRFFQFRRTDALVEFEDGTMARVYASDIQFADGGRFDKFEWAPMAEGGQDDGEE